MTNLLELVQSQLTGAMIDKMSNQIGANQIQTASAANGILSALISGLTKNAQRSGVDGLRGAIQNDHDGSILDNLSDFLGGSNSNLNQRTTNGSGILKHILGDKQGNIVDMISGMSGLDNSKTSGLMKMLAPIVMGALGKQVNTNRLDGGGLMDILTKTVSNTKTTNRGMGLFEQLLDSDGDGSAIDDIAGMGMKILGGFLKR